MIYPLIGVTGPCHGCGMSEPLPELPLSPRGREAAALASFRRFQDRWAPADPDLVSEVHWRLEMHYGDRVELPTTHQLQFLGNEVLCVVEAWIGDYPDADLLRLIRRAAGRVWGHDPLEYHPDEFDDARRWVGESRVEKATSVRLALVDRFGADPEVPSARRLGEYPDGVLDELLKVVESPVEPKSVEDLLDDAVLAWRRSLGVVYRLRDGAEGVLGTPGAGGLVVPEDDADFQEGL